MKRNYLHILKRPNKLRTKNKMLHNLNSENYPFATILCWCTAQILWVISDIFSPQLMNGVEVVLKFVSLLSALMILVINIKPFTKAVKNIFKKNE